MAKILIVDDDDDLSSALGSWLETEGHRAEFASDGIQGLEKLREHGYDLAFIDWEMPGITGTELVRRFRSGGGKTPLLMLTARANASDKELGLDSGADDYVTKPFDERELGARVRSLLRRASGVFTDELRVGKLCLDSGRSCITIDGRNEKLFRKEFDLLEFLLRHSNRYFSPEAIIHQVWESDSDSSIEALRTCISRLRKKLDVEGSPSLIENSKGWGYKISDYYLKT